jgi:hypothetical protein
MVIDRICPPAARVTAASPTERRTTPDSDSNRVTMLRIHEQQSAADAAPWRLSRAPVTVRGTMALLHRLPTHRASSTLRQRLLAIPDNEQGEQEQAP